MTVLLTVLFALLTAVSNALATVLQRKAAREVPPTPGLRLGLMLDLVRQPVWLAGIGAVLAAAVCQALALTWGSLALVQPIFVTELPFALLIGTVVLRRRLPPRGWAAVLSVAGGVALALACAAPGGGRPPHSPALWALVLICTGGAMAGCVTAALGRPRGRARAALFAIAAAIGYALTAALMKAAATAFAEDGARAFFTTWQTYGFFIAGAAALFLLSNAMAAGPLVASQPALTLGDALVSLSLGLVLYGEQVRAGWWLLPEAAGVGFVLAGTLVLSRVQSAAT